MFKTIYDVITTNSDSIEKTPEAINEIRDAVTGSLEKTREALDKRLGDGKFDVTLLQDIAVSWATENPMTFMLVNSIPGLADIFNYAFTMGIATAIEGKIR